MQPFLPLTRPTIDDGDFPHAEPAGRNILSLLLFPAMTSADVQRVVSALVDVLPATRQA